MVTALPDVSMFRRPLGVCTRQNTLSVSALMMYSVSSLFGSSVLVSCVWLVRSRRLLTLNPLSESCDKPVIVQRRCQGVPGTVDAATQRVVDAWTLLS